MGNGRKMKRSMDAKAIDRGELVAEIKRLGAENLRRRKDNERLARELAESQMALGASLDLLNALTWMEGRLSAVAEDDFLVHVPAAEGEDVYHGKTPAEAIVAAWAEYVRQGNEARTKIRAYVEEHGLLGDEAKAAEVLDPSYPIEKVNEELRALGCDPEAIGARGVSLARELLVKRKACPHDSECAASETDSPQTCPEGVVCPNDERTRADVPAPVNDMALPEGRTCGECAYWPVCGQLITGIDSTSRLCHASPSQWIPPVVSNRAKAVMARESAADDDAATLPPPSDDVGPGPFEPAIPEAPETTCLGDEEEAEVQP